MCIFFFGSQIRFTDLLKNVILPSSIEFPFTLPPRDALFERTVHARHKLLSALVRRLRSIELYAWARESRGVASRGRDDSRVTGLQCAYDRRPSVRDGATGGGSTRTFLGLIGGAYALYVRRAVAWGFAVISRDFPFRSLPVKTNRRAYRYRPIHLSYCPVRIAPCGFARDQWTKAFFFFFYDFVFILKLPLVIIVIYLFLLFSRNRSQRKNTFFLFSTSVWRSEFVNSFHRFHF